MKIAFLALAALASTCMFATNSSYAVSQPICYIINNAGQMFDLSQMCNKTLKEQKTQKSADYITKDKTITVTDINLRYSGQNAILTGTITNQGNSSIRIENLTFQFEFDNTILSQETLALNVDLAPGKNLALRKVINREPFGRIPATQIKKTPIFTERTDSPLDR